MKRWQIQRQRGFEWLPFEIRIDGVVKVFKTRREAVNYLYDNCWPIGRNERYKFVRV